MSVGTLLSLVVPEWKWDQNFYELEIHEIDENFGHGLVIRPLCSFGMFQQGSKVEYIE